MMKLKFVYLLILLVLMTPLFSGEKPGNKKKIIILDIGKHNISRKEIKIYTKGDPVQLEFTDLSRFEHSGNDFLFVHLSGPELLIKRESSYRFSIEGFGDNNLLRKSFYEIQSLDLNQSAISIALEICQLPPFDSNDLIFLNSPFRNDKPTIFIFGGGNCDSGTGMLSLDNPLWLQKANIFSVIRYEKPYERYGDMLIEFLSRNAPEYDELIQTIGFSTGGNPAMVIANHLNHVYGDKRYCVNKVSLFDAPCMDFVTETEKFNSLKFEGEPMMVDNYIVNADFIPGAVNINFPGGNHSTPLDWFVQSINPVSYRNGDMYNDGVTAGSYISVTGTGRNLTLGENHTFFFNRINSEPEYLEFGNFDAYPGKLPEPAILIGPDNGSIVNSSGIVLSCLPAGNSSKYELLIGERRDCLNTILAETTEPPMNLIKTFPYNSVFWTVKVYDRFGSSIYADPKYFEFRKDYRKTISITNPANGEIVAGEVPIEVEIEGSASPVIEIRADEHLLETLHGPPYTLIWDTSSESQGPHSVKVRDVSGDHSTSSGIVVNVQNLKLDIEVIQREINFWILSMKLNMIRVTANETGTPNVFKYVLYRNRNGSYFEGLQEIDPSEISNGVFEYSDYTADQDHYYSYFISAVDESGKIISKSETSEYK